MRISAAVILTVLVAGCTVMVIAPTVAVAQSRLPQCFMSYILSGNLTDCQGAYTLEDGSRYVGEWKDNKRNGQGEQTYRNGQRYVGEWRDDKQDGQGTATWPSGQQYVGEFKNGQRSGQGTHTLPNGEKYVGEFKDDKFNGQGTYTWPDGSIYVGEFRDGTENGQGTYTWPDGHKYVGEYRDGKVSRGTVTWPDGRVVSVSPAGIPIEIQGGTATVSVTLNGKLTLDFIIDSGATDVQIPADVVLTLFRTGSIVKEDFLGQQQYQLADGSTVPSPVFVIRSLKVGDKVLENVRASVASVNGSLLLGQSFLNRFNSWSVDNRNRLLFLN